MCRFFYLYFMVRVIVICRLGLIFTSWHESSGILHPISIPMDRVIFTYKLLSTVV